MLKRFQWLCVLVFISALLTACGAPSGQPAKATHAVPTKGALPIIVATDVPLNPSGGDVLNRVRNDKKIIVGITADYPPFSFYNTNVQLDGFDAEIMRNVAKKMGVEVVFKDMAFEGLPAALETGQIQAAISAISITPKREQIMDFSQVYFVSADGVLANTNAAIPEIRTIADLSSYRIGVEKGTIYEKWIQNGLIAPKKMPAQNLQAYTLLSQALKDLRAGRIDVVLLDLIPAQMASKAGDLKLVGSELDQQQYGIAVKLGQAGLQQALNQAIAQLQQEGAISTLAKQYLGSEVKILPTPTAMVTPPYVTPSPPAPNYCVDGMAFSADLTLPDNHMANPAPVNPNSPVNKGWRIVNTGTCTWDSSYRLSYVGSWPTNGYMSGQPVSIKGSVPPGGSYDIYATLIAPPYPGKYMSFWNMVSRNGISFGDRIYAGVNVGNAPLPTPVPTFAPDPAISFTASKTSISAGNPVTFTWSAPKAIRIAFGLAGATYPVPNPGADQESPLISSTYELRVTYPNGSTKVRQIGISVMINPGGPIITHFDINPPYEIIAGNCVDLSWSIVNNVTRVTLLRGGSTISDGAPASSSYHDCIQDMGDYTYTLKAQNDQGSTVAYQYISVKGLKPTWIPGPTDEPFPTWVPAPTEEPFPTWVPEPTEEPFPTWLPGPTDEPEPTWVPAPTDEPDGPMPGPIEPDNPPEPVKPDDPAPAPPEDEQDS